MKILATLINLVFIGIAVMILFKVEFNRPFESFLFYGFLLFFVVNIIAVNRKKGSSFLSLFPKRKAAEAKAKIKELE